MRDSPVEKAQRGYKYAAGGDTHDDKTERITHLTNEMESEQSGSYVCSDVKHEDRTGIVIQDPEMGTLHYS